MSIELIVFIGCISLVAGFVKGVAVLGFSLVATPLLVLMLEPRDVLVALVVPVLFMDALLLVLARTSLATRRMDSPLILGGVIGAVIGAFAVATLDQRPLAVGVGFAVAVFALVSGHPSGPAAPRGAGRPVPAISCTVGLIAGVTGFFGPPIMSYLQHLQLPRQLLVSTAASTFIALGLVRAATMTAMGLVEKFHLSLAIALLAPALAGVALGSRVREHIPEKGFTQLVRLLIIFSGGWIAIKNLVLLLY